MNKMKAKIKEINNNRYLLLESGEIQQLENCPTLSYDEFKTAVMYFSHGNIEVVE